MHVNVLLCVCMCVLQALMGPSGAGKSTLMVRQILAWERLTALGLTVGTLNPKHHMKLTAKHTHESRVRQ